MNTNKTLIAPQNFDKTEKKIELDDKFRLFFKKKEKKYFQKVLRFSQCQENKDHIVNKKSTWQANSSLLPDKLNNCWYIHVLLWVVTSCYF